MKLIGETVIHGKYGAGTICSLEEKILRVEFNGEVGRKAFVYPDAFEQYLQLRNTEARQGMQQLLREAKEQLAREQEAKRLAEEQRQEALRLEKLELAKRKKKPSKTAAPRAAKSKAS